MTSASSTSACKTKQIGVVGLATVCRAHYADPADKAWAVVDVEYRDTYRQIVSLDALKQHRDGALAGMALFKMSRLSVQLGLYPCNQKGNERVPSTLRFRKFPGKTEGVWCSIRFLSSFPRETREFP